MARIVVTVSSDLFDDSNQEASIRENLPIRTLLAEARKEFSLPEGNYLIRVKTTGKILDPEKTLEQSGVQTGAMLILSKERRATPRTDMQQNEPEMGRRSPITGARQAYLRDEETGVTFDIRWQPP